MSTNRNRFDEEQVGGFVRHQNRNRRNGNNGKVSERGRWEDELRVKVPDVSPCHRAKNMITEARLSDEDEINLLTMIDAAGTKEVVRLLDSGELKEQIEQARA